MFVGFARVTAMSLGLFFLADNPNTLDTNPVSPEKIENRNNEIKNPSSRANWVKIWEILTG